MLLSDVETACLVDVVAIELPEESRRHLGDLGLKMGARLEVLSRTKTSAIVKIKASRLAFDSSILSKVEVSPSGYVSEQLPLSEVAVGEFVLVESIVAVNEVKRRLMDMGVTRHTKIFLRKVAPLGDPIEICLRGYELTLRKSEAQLIRVSRLKVGE